MNSIDQLDIFNFNPIRGFKNAGTYHRTKSWSWNSDVPYAAFYYVIKGQMKLSIQGKQWVAGPDDVIFLRSCDHAVLSNDAQLQHCFVSFYYDEQFDMKIDTVLRSTGTEQLFQKIIQAHRSNATMSRLRVDQLFLQLLYQLAMQSADRHRELGISAKLQAAVEYIHVHYDQKLSVGQLCALTGYSPAHLRRLFEQHFGMSPMEYIQSKRMEAAKELLMDDPVRTLEEISQSLGICSVSYFCKLFKQYTKQTPLEFRRNTQKALA